MFRALVTLIQLQMIKLEKKPNCVLIDDIGEGLDFDRATKLISIVIDQAENGYSQYLMTTNDRFVQNNVSLGHWCAIEREAGEKCKHIPRGILRAHSRILKNMDSTTLTSLQKDSFQKVLKTAQNEKSGICC